MVVVWLILAGTCGTLIYVMASALAGRAMGLSTEWIAIGGGPPLYAFDIGRTRLRFGPIFFSAAVNFRDTEADPLLEPESATQHRLRTGWIAFSQLALYQRIVAYMIGPAALLLVATLLIGPQAWHTAAATGRGLLQLMLAPVENAAFLSDAIGIFAAERPRARIGLVLSVYAGINLLPFAMLPAGLAISAVVRDLAGMTNDSALVRGYLLASLAAALWLLLILAIQAWRLVAPGMPGSLLP